MIEKLREQDLHLGYIEPEEVLLKKINELVDAVNKMLCWHGNLPRFWQNLSQKENTENKEPAQNVQDKLDRTRKALGDTIKLAEQMLESIQDEGMCSSYYEDTLNKIKSITKGGDNGL